MIASFVSLLQIHWRSGLCDRLLINWMEGKALGSPVRSHPIVLQSSLSDPGKALNVARDFIGTYDAKEMIPCFLFPAYFGFGRNDRVYRVNRLSVQSGSEAMH
jgi:hypothetical protein